MIKLESAHIEEVRGIRKLDIDFGKETFAISGPNGSGKSGVIDAIEFALTGEISRLTGTGTKGLTVAEHGPHVDKTKFPDAAFVTVRVFLPGIGKSATITRKLSSPTKPKIDPPDADVKEVLAEIAEHPEVTLSRRDILRFILTEPTKRSQEIQAILKLDDIEETRSALNTAQNRLNTAHRTAVAQQREAQSALQMHLQIATLRAEDLLDAVNKRRKTLALPEVLKLTADTQLDSGLSASTKLSDFNKESALRELKVMSEALRTFPDFGKVEAAAIVADLNQMESDPGLLAALQRRAFIESGLRLLDGAACPLCDTAWPDEQHLREHVKAKLAKSEESRKLQEALFANAGAITQAAIRVAGLLTPIQKLAETQREENFARLLNDWKAELEVLRAQLRTVEGLVSLKDRLATGWLQIPKGVSDDLSRFAEKIATLPDQTAAVDAQTFLAKAQLRLADYREAMRKEKAADNARETAKVSYDAYCGVLEDELNALYEEVQTDFCTFYRMINEGDEADFTAKLTPTQGSLGLDVNFYGRGLFPPAAYHSEGHQDGMGVCLYLALMKRLFGSDFTIALLDDVVMSVDTDHRYQFCRLLKTQFPNTQFIITTHDRLWAQQMRSSGLVSRKTSLSFHSWSVDTGPLVESNTEIWDEISTALTKGKVEVSASALRRHLEYVSWHLADQLGASPPFRADGRYELGDLLPAILKRLKELYGRAAAAAQSWGDTAKQQDATSLKDSLSASNAAMNVEQWAVNPAVHYNAWANFGKKDFEPVVAAYKELLNCFRCSTCDAWVHVTPRVNPEVFRCDCGKITFNLNQKPK